MSLHWAWSFGASGGLQDYFDSGWDADTTGSLVNPNLSGSPLPRQPEGGSGGMTKGCGVFTGYFMHSPPFPRGALSDGQAQYHWQHLNTNTGIRILRLLAADGAYLLELRPTTNDNTSTLTVYSGEGVSALTSRGTTTATVTEGQWHVIAVRFKKGTSGGEIAVSIDGVSETIVSNGNTGVTSDWARIGCQGGGSNWCYFTGITVWDDGPNDDALTVTRWIGTLRATSDDTDGSWLNESASATDLYLSTREDPIDPTTTYCKTVTDPDEVRFGVDTTDATYGFGSSWSPDTVDGVSVSAFMQGDGGLMGGRTVIDDGVNNLQGTLATTGAGPSMGVSDTFATQADGSSSWSKAALDSHTYGVRAS